MFYRYSYVRVACVGLYKRFRADLWSFSFVLPSVVLLFCLLLCFVTARDLLVRWMPSYKVVVSILISTVSSCATFVVIRSSSCGRFVFDFATYASRVEPTTISLSRLSIRAAPFPIRKDNSIDHKYLHIKAPDKHS